MFASFLLCTLLIFILCLNERIDRSIIVVNEQWTIVTLMSSALWMLLLQSRSRSGRSLYVLLNGGSIKATSMRLERRHHSSSWGNRNASMVSATDARAVDKATAAAAVPAVSKSILVVSTVC